MNNKVGNLKKEVPTGIALNDKDYITDLLSTLKAMEKNYVVALTETSNEFLYQKLYEMFNKIAIQQRNVYELMFSLGWYQLERAEKQKVEEKHQMLSKEFHDLHG